MVLFEGCWTYTGEGVHSASEIRGEVKDGVDLFDYIIPPNLIK